jgi:hypothetical protein
MSIMSINWTEPIPLILNMITEGIKMLNSKQDSKNLEISIEKSRLDNELKKINTKHKVLARQIFYPLYQNIVSIIILKNKLPSITFTASQIRSSLHYNDGLEHLIQSIPDFSTRLEEIETGIEMYNADLNDFHQHRMEDYVRNYIEENGFRLRDEEGNTTIIAIDLSILLPELISYWFKDKTDIEFIPSENSVKIHVTLGLADIAITNNDEDKNRIRNLVTELKDLNIIKMELQKFYGVITKIYTMAEEISTDIGNNIIRFIELDEYDDICTICKDSKS